MGEVVDDVEDPPHGLVDGLGAGQVRADRLLQDDPGSVGGEAELVQVLADRAVQRGSDREVEDTDDLVAGRSVLESVVEGVPGGGVLDIQAHVEQSSEQAVDDRLGQLVGRDVLGEGFCDQRAVAVVVDLRA